ncbi:MAG: gliding motility-associated C-terminal domain-containing protein [Saprospirales bacterium]|nr:gliding motility-associated C-terminal domain-containing protein [Saprospirales bacterium]
MTGLLPGNYSVTVTSPISGCSATAVYNLPNVNNSFSITGSTTPVTNCGLPNGAVDISVFPSGAYSFSWSNGSTTEDLTGIPAGTYSVTVTEAGACSDEASFTVEEQLVLPSVSQTVTAATCGQSNGAVSLTVTPPGAYTFLWSNGATTQNLSNIPAGSYIVTVTGSGGCTGQASATVPDNSFIPDISGTASPNTLCIGSNGSISITVSPANTYTFNWSNGATTQDILNLAAGTYSVTVSAGGSCFDSAIFTLDNNTQPPGLSANVTPSVCGLPNGAIGLTVSPGGTYQFNWSNGANTEDLTGLLPGNYSVTVTSPISGCTATAVYNVPNNNTSFSLTGTTTPVTNCGQPNGAVDISVFPSGAYSFSWSNGSTTEDLTGIPAGTYSVTVTEAGACSDEASFTVEEQLVLPSVSQTATAATCGQSNGAIDLSVSPSGVYSYLWSNGSTNEDLSNVVAGNYMVTVTGTNACTATAAIDIPNDTTIFILSANLVANTSCTSANGAIDLNISPTGNYLFAWSNGATSEDLQNIAAGSFSVTVTEGATCTSTATFEVPNESGAPDLSVVATQSVCGENNGSLDVSISPSGIYDYLWSTGDTTEDLTDLVPGSYSVTVTDTNGCSSIASTVVAGSVVNFSATGSIVPNNSCAAANGSIGLTMSIPGNFTFLWSNGATSQDLQGLAAGSYSVTVTLGITCDFSATYDIPDLSESPVISENSVPAMCGQTNGAIDLSVMPATGNTFLWSNGATTEDLQNIAPGIYSVTCTGANGCISTDTVEVLNENTVISLSALPSANTSCVSPNGALDLTVSATGSYTILWSNGATTEDISGIPSGNYSVTVTDISGCSETVSATVDGPVQPPVPVIVIDTTNCDGTATLDAGQGYASYLWSNGSTAPAIVVSVNGAYTVTVSDSLGCTGMAVGNLVLPQPPQVTILGAGSICQGDSTILSAPGNFDQYLWSTGEMTPEITIAEGGVYSVTVIDSNGCTATDEWIVAQLLSDFVFIQTTACFPQDTGTVQVVWSNQFGCDSIVVTSTVLEQPVFTVLEMSACEGESVLFNGVEIPAGDSQDFVFTGANGCDSIVSVYVLAFPPVNFNLTATKTCWNSEDGSISVWMLSGQQPFQYSIDGGAFQDDPLFTGLPGGNYTLEVMDANGCISPQNTQVPQTPPLQVVAEDRVLSCDLGETTLQPMLISGNPDDLVWTWPDGSHNPWLKVKDAGTYIVQVDDGCQVIEIPIEVTWEEDYSRSDFFYIPNCFTPNGDGINDVFRVFPGKSFEVISFEFRIFDRWGMRCSPLSMLRQAGTGFTGGFKDSRRFMSGS